jgi:hypothetical protein
MAGGVEPHWRRDGRELYFAGDGIWAVDVSTAGAQFQSGTPRKIFDDAGAVATNAFITGFDVAPDGRRFLLNVNAAAANRRTTPPIRVIVNWSADLDLK